jgi:ParB family chromosome partitioning protein
MAAKKRAKATRKKSGAARKRLTPAKEKRGLEATSAPLAHDGSELAELSNAVRAAGGAPAGAYRDPLSSHALLLAVLPLEAIEPTPFQRDLADSREAAGAEDRRVGPFLDPASSRCAAEPVLTPNGRHRLAAQLLGMRAITALVSGDEALAYRSSRSTPRRRTTPGPQPGSDSHGAGAGRGAAARE